MAFASNPYYSVITIDHALVGGALTDFVLYLDDLPADAFASIHSTGKDIRFSDATGTTELAFDLRAIDTGAGTCEIMVKVPSVSAVSDTDIRIWYGDHTLSLYAATDTYGRNAVYSNFEAVFSLSESATGATGSAIYIDRTGNGYDGRDYADATGKTGVVGDGQEFDGSNDYIEFSADWVASLPCTVLCWININASASGFDTVFGSDLWNTDQAGINLQVNSSTKIAMNYGDGGGTVLANRKTKTGVSTLTKGEWYHIGAVVRNTGDNMDIYLNGADDGGAYSGSAASVANTAQVPRIGSASTGSLFWGFIDELWIAESDLGSAYISTLYQNQNAAFGTFYSVGIKTNNPLAFTPIISWF